MTSAFRQLGIGLAVFTAGAAMVAGAFALANAAGKFEQGLAAVGAVTRATSRDLAMLRNAAIEAGIQVFDQSTGRMRSMVDIMSEFADRTRDMSDEERNRRVVQAFGARGLLAFNAVMNASFTTMRDGADTPESPPGLISHTKIPHAGADLAPRFQMGTSRGARRERGYDLPKSGPVGPGGRTGARIDRR
jgi:hypothetical protein